MMFFARSRLLLNPYSSMIIVYSTCILELNSGVFQLLQFSPDVMVVHGPVMGPWGLLRFDSIIILRQTNTAKEIEQPSLSYDLSKIK